MSTLMTHDVVGDDIVVANHGQSGLWARLADFVSERRARFSAMRARRRNRAELRRLDDRTLKDIGLSRSEILYVASDPPFDRD